MGDDERIVSVFERGMFVVHEHLVEGRMCVAREWSGS